MTRLTKLPYPWKTNITQARKPCLTPSIQTNSVHPCSGRTGAWYMETEAIYFGLRRLAPSIASSWRQFWKLHKSPFPQ